MPALIYEFIHVYTSLGCFTLRGCLVLFLDAWCAWLVSARSGSMYVKSVMGYALGLVSTMVNAVMMLAMVMMRLRKGFFILFPPLSDCMRNIILYLLSCMI